MNDVLLRDPVELSDVEVDQVAAGAAGAAGLIAVAVNVSNSLNNNTIQVANDVLNNNKVFVVL